MVRRKEHLTMNIERLRKAIQKKYRQFKQGSMDTELEMEKQYKPIIRAIKTHDPLSVKQEMKAEDHKSTYDDDDDVGDEKSAYDDDSNLGQMYDDESQHEEFKPSMTSTPRADAELT